MLDEDERRRPGLADRRARSSGPPRLCRPGSPSARRGRAGRVAAPGRRQREPLLLAAGQLGAIAALHPSNPTATGPAGTRARIAAGGQARFSSPKATSSSTRSMTSWVGWILEDEPDPSGDHRAGAPNASSPSSCSDPSTCRGSGGTSPGDRQRDRVLPSPTARPRAGPRRRDVELDVRRRRAVGPGVGDRESRA